ncbi:MAG: [citrate (pro-3S)-lyase] ligase [Asgard group archaeon]|nr:[citrate (pro-3S)-lyase] ligase [Asgard group archaeon]
MLTYIEEYYENPTKKQRETFSQFLEKQGLEYEDKIEMTLKVINEATGEMIGTGSIDGNVIKCLAIDPKRRGEGLSAHILSLLVKEEYQRGRDHIFIFSHPKNIEETSGNVFAGFKVVSQTDDIVLLEMGSRTIDDYISDLKEKTKEIREKNLDEIGSVVVNCNPFTLGHQYLIETAAKDCEFLYVFVVDEDRSTFPTDIRYQLIKKGTQHLDNVMVLHGGEYIISPATFPRYFMKDFDNIVLSQARLDVTIFAEYIASALGITKRYVGNEPYCEVTNSYNQAMKEILIPQGIKLEIIDRKSKNGEIISASKVRQYLRDEEFEKIKPLVPETTYDFLISDDAKPIIRLLKENDSRH